MNDSCAISSPGIELDRHAGQVVELERQRPLPARVAEAGGRVHDQPQAPETRLALDPRDDVVGQLDPLERPPEAELSGVDHERLALGDHDLLGQVLRRAAQVDRRRTVVVKDAKRVAEPEVDARRLDQRSSHGSILIRPSATSREIVPSDRTDAGASLIALQSASDRGAGVSGRACVPWRARCAPGPAAAARDRRAGRAAGGAGTACGGCGRWRLMPPSSSDDVDSSGSCLIAHQTM